MFDFSAPDTAVPVGYDYDDYNYTDNNYGDYNSSDYNYGDYYYDYDYDYGGYYYDYDYNYGDYYYGDYNDDTTGWSNCSQDAPCADGEGDCDNHTDCEGALLCGNDNCAGGPTGMDCCTNNGN